MTDRTERMGYRAWRAVQANAALAADLTAGNRRLVAREEEALQRAVIDLCRLRRVDRWALYFHAPNGGWRSALEACIFKSLGVLAGVPDLVFLLAGGGAACLELKAPSGRLSPAQRAFRATCERLHVPYRVARDLDGAGAAIDEFRLLAGREGEESDHRAGAGR